MVETLFALCGDGDVGVDYGFACEFDDVVVVAFVACAGLTLQCCDVECGREGNGHC